MLSRQQSPTSYQNTRKNGNCFRTIAAPVATLVKNLTSAFWARKKRYRKHRSIFLTERLERKTLFAVDVSISSALAESHEVGSSSVELGFGVSHHTESDFIIQTNTETLTHDGWRHRFGDANLDGKFNSADLARVFATGKYENGGAADWTEGDWNADGVFDSSDLVAAFEKTDYSPDQCEDGVDIPVLKDPIQAIRHGIGDTTIQGTLDLETDVHLIRVDMVIAQTLELTVSSHDELRPRLRVLNVFGDVLVETEQTTRLRLVPDTYFVEVSGYDNTTVGYELNARKGVLNNVYPRPLNVDDDHVDTIGDGASELSIGGWFARAGGQIGKPCDKDMFRVEVAEDTRFVVQLSQLDNSLVPTLRLLDRNGLPVADDEIGFELSIGPGTYYFEVGGLGNTTGSYALTVEALKPDPPELPWQPADASLGEDIHPDVIAESITDISLDGIVVSHLDEVGDRDLFRLDVRQSDLVFFQVSGSDESFEPMLRILQPSGQQITEANTKLELVLQPGIYYVEVSAASLATGTYKLEVLGASELDADPVDS